MKKAFKIATVIGSTVLLGVGAIAGGVSFSPFVDNNTPNFSVVYGETSADGPSSIGLGNYLNGLVTPDVVLDDDNDLSSGIGKVSITQGTENDDLSLGEYIPAETFDDGDIDFLIDDKIEWDDGDDIEEYNVHEEIGIIEDKVGFISLLDDEDLSEDFALTNNKGLTYRYIFDDEINFENLDNDDADNLEIKFLGKNIEIKEAEDNSITIVTSKEYKVTEGQTVNVGGKEIVIGMIFENSVEVGNNFIKEGKSEKVNGIIVEVETIAYHSSGNSKAIIRVGNDISQEYSSNDAYLGEDEDDPRWVWDIDLNADKPYIGIIYNEKETDANDDVLYAGEAYTFPESYAAVKFDGTTNVDDMEFTLSIDEEELYNETEHELFDGDDMSVVILEGDDESIETSEDEETSKIYLRHDGAGKIESYYYDEDEKHIMRYNSDVDDGAQIATLINDDKEVGVHVRITGAVTKYMEVYFFDNGEEQIVTKYRLDTTDEILSLGGEAEEAEASEVTLLDKSVGNKDYDIVNENGYRIMDPETNGENDEVTFSIPSDDVEASVSVGKPGTIDTTDDTDDTDDTPVNEYTFITTKVSQIDNVKNRNLVIVGGSCINGVSAQLLGKQACGAEFTALTGVGPGKAIIKSFISPYNDDKIAVMVAGYNKADTDKAIVELKKGTYDLTVGNEYII